MTDWIEQFAAKIKEQDAKRRHDEEAALQNAQLVKERAHAAWGELRIRIERETQEINSHFSSEPHRQLELQTSDLNTVSICKSHAPGGQLRLQFNTGARRIEYSFRVFGPSGKEPQTETGSIEFQAQGNNLIFIHEGEARVANQMSRILLEKFLNLPGF